MKRSLRRGQAMVLMMLTMLLLVLMVCMTLGISSRAKERANLQAMADAAAFSTATATARTYNVASVLNRAMVAHYAAMATIQAENAWVTSVMKVMSEAAGLAREMDIPDPSQAGTCPSATALGHWPPTWSECPLYWRIDGNVSCRSNLLRPVSYELWHAALSNYHPNPKYPGDSVNGKCADGVPIAAMGCSAPRSFLGPKGFPELDREVADQQKAIHEAIYDLAKMQSKTYTKLKNDLSNGTITKAIVERDRGKNGWGTFSSKANSIAKSELDAATDVLQAHKAPYADTMGQAVMGARIASLALEHDRDVFTRRTTQLLASVNSNMASLPGNWDISIAPKPEARGMVTPSVSEDSANDRENFGFDPTMRVVYGDMMVHLTIKWTLPCGPNAGTRKSLHEPVRTVVGATDTDAWHFLHDGGGHTGPSGTTWNACHVNHAHYGENDQSIHELNHKLLPEEALGFVFPVTGDKGAQGIWGMPKMPVVLSEGAAPKQPWELDFKFQLDKSTSGTKLDLRDGLTGELPKLAAYSAGVAYYHRRGHVGEPPNMLNPYWRATLVPAEIDEHKKSGGDFTPGSGTNSRATAGNNGPLKFDGVSRGAYKKLHSILKPLEGPG